MASDELRKRLAKLPGVVSCTVDDETVALVLDHDVDPRLLKARAQAVCAEMGESRPLIVVGGRNFGAARAGAGLGAGAGAAGWRSGVPAFFARRATPVSIAVMSLVVLSAVVLAPDDGVGPGPQFRPPSSPSVVAVGPPPRGAPPVARPGPPALTNVAPLSPLVVPAPIVVPVPGPVLGGLTTTDFDLVPSAFRPGGVATPVVLTPIDIGPPVAAPAPAGEFSIPSAPAPSATPAAGAAPPSAPAPTATPAPIAPTTPPAGTAPSPAPIAAPTPTAPTPAASASTSRSSAPLLAASSTTEKGTKSNYHGRRQPVGKAASAEGPGSSTDRGTAASHETTKPAGPDTKPDTPAPSRNPEGPDRHEKRQEKAETPEKPERVRPNEGHARSEQPSPSSTGAKGEERSGGTGRPSGRGN